MFSWAGRVVFLGGAILNCSCWSLTVNALWTNKRKITKKAESFALGVEVSKNACGPDRAHGLQ